MLTEDKVTELFCMPDSFYKFFDSMMEKYTLKFNTKELNHIKGGKSCLEMGCVLSSCRNRARGDNLKITIINLL